MSIISIYRLLSVIIFSIVSFLDILGLLTLLSQFLKMKKEAKLGIALIMTLLLVFIVIHNDDFIWYKYVMMTYACVSGVLIAYVFNKNGVSDNSELTTISQFNSLKGNFFLKAITSGLISVGFLLFWQWVAYKLILDPF